MTLAQVVTLRFMSACKEKYLMFLCGADKAGEEFKVWHFQKYAYYNSEMKDLCYVENIKTV